jgi:hypothetical protein
MVGHQAETGRYAAAGTQILMAPDALPVYIEFSGRLEDLEIQAGHVGWGYGETVTEIVNNLNARWEEDEASTRED